MWNRIRSNENKNELVKILDSEIEAGNGLCFTGKINRLINTLNGFYDDIKVNISDKEQINNWMIILKNKYNNLIENELKEKVKNDLINEYNVDDKMN